MSILNVISIYGALNDLCFFGIAFTERMGFIT